MTFSNFYKKTREDRINILKEEQIISNESADKLLNNQTLDVNIAGKMAENHIGTFALPFGVVNNFIVNNKPYTIPMVTEEPSVIAACNNAAKTIGKSGGFSADILDRKMIGQVALYDVENIDLALENLQREGTSLLKLANEAHPSIVKRGGGACDISHEIINFEDTSFLVVYLTVDVKEAMGANILNTMLEAIKPTLETLTNGTALMGILSNYATKSLVKATCTIDVSTLNKDILEARNIAHKISLASKLAQADVYRATTHNKGIFNGIDAIVIASGNDWRAVEAACHAYAVKDNKYRGLATWNFDKNSDKLNGELTLPMPVASVGGSIGLNDTVKIAHEIMNNPDAKTLATIIVSVGLAQNFAALKALVSVGIQQGHMKLHAKSLAMLAGANESEADIVAKKLTQEKHINLATAQQILETIR
ncbi:hydroxymethylglutaryl-CoA reductase, degradative [Gemella sp. GH3]|uniref:hydroxymethylglutaryl-CoA reductase, degradative n=1 Tax=unclassified Gemella TaxID=2624949 RepID=UPI0015CFA8BA|nr:MULTISPECIES: hydroxymethylglutaryl-CoA reductase, degradative [unclassified Gemella]MBF0713606.1 hydroxymethylglutaryl-CoA reductase, degradative [Gemella sp. GH3.1]NYS50558.1 hydroxymethylglutaryl-CoA reductase, degradative [Gemella sp. GH3]